MADWSEQVAKLVAAAEEAAEKTRRDAERRADERIAEADRAAEFRVKAAEEEARELLAQAGAESARIRREADEHAKLVQASAEEDARGLTREARFVAQAVLKEGTGMHDDLQEMSRSLRRNAERLLGDVRDAHARLAGEVDRTVGSDDSRPRRATVDAGDDVPEFIPPG
ncbi:MAG TPA: hypothetical protein VNB64_00110 [Solirubrobacteraceae bacterium]|nr:hypothetical protein [Solirubrobacteraceae bacterium]